MHNGRIAHFEDDRFMALAVEDAISLTSDDRHQIVAKANTLSGSLDVLNQIAAGDIDANIVLSDGNLSPGNTGSDAREIMERVKELGLNVRTILLSLQSAEEIGVTADASVLKSERRLGARLIQIIDALEDPQKEAE